MWHNVLKPADRPATAGTPCAGMEPNNMAAANESQGLKIAVAAFVALTVILGVTTYFGYSQYGQSEAKLAEETKKLNDVTAKVIKTEDEVTTLKAAIGIAAAEDAAAAKAAMDKDKAKVGEQLADMKTKVTQFFDQYKAAGGTDKKVEELKAAVDAVVGQYTDDLKTNASYQSTQNHAIELMSNMTQLMVALSLDNESLRDGLGKTNQVAEQKVQVQTDAAKKAADDVIGLTAEKEKERSSLLERVDALQTEVGQKNTLVTKLENDVTAQRKTFDDRVKVLLNQLRGLRENADKNEVTLGKPSGKITFVDYNRGEVRVDIGRSKGATEQLQFTVFDKASPGLPTDRPKAKIELVQVSDRDAVARIDTATTEELRKKIDPRTGRGLTNIRVGDFIYSPGFGGKTYALLGKLDIDRDGKDDREDVRRMLEATGAKIIYDLPPPEKGKETGDLTGNITNYVIDERPPFNPQFDTSKSSPEAERAFLDRKGIVTQQLRDAGVQPKRLEVLLDGLGYTNVPNRVGVGRVEAINKEASERLQNPLGRAKPKAAPTAPPTPPEAKPDMEPK